MDPQQLLARLRTLTSSFTPTQLATLGGAFVAVVGILAGSSYYMNQPNYVLLYSDMDAEAASQIVTRLKTEKIVYQLDEGGRSIRVPAGKVDELRLDLSSQGLPSSGRIGFEIFDRTSFGATEFLEQVNYRRALEGEIGRTIATISEVSNARVHIAMGKDSLFGESKPAKASVILKLRNQRGLPESTVAGISNLVASSVDGLSPDAVVILDSFGRPLTRPDADAGDPLGAQQVERQQRMEREMTTRVVALLEPLVGSDRVRVNVALKLNPKTQEETQEIWDPNAVVRSRQTNSDQATSAAAQLIAGTRANAPALPPPPGPTATPPAPAPGTLAQGPGSSRTAETTNYEVSRTTRHTLAPAGEVARLSVAVVIDDNQVMQKGSDGKSTVTHKPRTPAELTKIQGIVAAAVGLEADRGDQLTVENVAFDEPLVEEVPPQTMMQQYAPQIWEGSRIAVIAIIGLIALLMFVRPMLRRAGLQTATAAAAAARLAAPAAASAAAMAAAAGGGTAGLPAPRTVADLENEIELQIDAAAAQNFEGRRLPVLTRKVTAISTKEPENVAKLLRTWIMESER